MNSLPRSTRVVLPALALVTLLGCTPAPTSPSADPSMSPASATSAPSATPSAASASASPTSASTLTSAPSGTLPTTGAPSVPPAKTDLDYALWSSPDRQLDTLPHVDLQGMVPFFPDYQHQPLRWQTCDQLECTGVLVPMDYAHPEGPMISLTMTRRKATGSRLGVLVLNPGGPGGTSTGMPGSPRYDRLAEHYDLIGLDPRGTGGSTPVVCTDGDNLMDAVMATDASPDDDAEFQQLVAANKALADGCAKGSGDYLHHVSTNEAVKDFDFVRQLLGEEKLNFLGYSYGTFLGSVYAARYPDRVGRMVLDSAVNITDDASVSQVMGFDVAFGNFATWAAGRGALGKTKEEVTKGVTDFLDKLDAEPLKVKSRTLNQTLAGRGLLQPMYGEEKEWTALESALVSAYQGDGQALLDLADQMNRRSKTGRYGSINFSYFAIMCSDAVDAGIQGGRRVWEVDKQRAPLFGKYAGLLTGCETWHVPAPKHERLTAPSAPPIIVIGNTGDSATPYQQAPWMADQLGSGVLLTRVGPGHGAYGKDPCINDTVNAYFLDGVVPQKGSVCKA